jgi:hypothetical protein
MDGEARNWLQAGLGTSFKEIVDNLVAQALDDEIQKAIEAAMTGAPDPEELSGTWKAQITIASVTGGEGAGSSNSGGSSAGGSSAGSSGGSGGSGLPGCDVSFDPKMLLGKTLPVGITLVVGAEGNGTARMSGKGVSPASGTVAYDKETGQLTIRIVQAKAALSMKGEAKRLDSGDPKKLGPVELSGTFTMVGGPITISGPWNAKK